MSDPNKKSFRIPRIVLFFLCCSLLSSLVISGTWLYTRYFVSDEDKLRNSLKLIEVETEHKAVRLILREVSESYTDQFNKNKKALAEKLQYWASRNLSKEVDINFSEITINIDPSGKTGSATFLMSGNAPVKQAIKYIRRRQADDVRLRLNYKNEDGSWLIVSGEYIKD